MNENDHDQQRLVEITKNEPPTPEIQTTGSLSLDLLTPESPEFLELQQKLIEQSGCPNIEKDPKKFTEWLEKAHTLKEYLGYLATVSKTDPYGFLQGNIERINDLAILAKDSNRRKSNNPEEIITLAFAYIKEQANVETAALKLNPNRTYDELETKNLYRAFNPQQRNFWYGHGLENTTNLYLQIDQTQTQALIDSLKQWLPKARIKDEIDGFHIRGSEPLGLYLPNPQTTGENFVKDTKRYGTVFVPTVEIRPLAYGIRHDEIPNRPYTEPPVSSLYGEPAVLKDSDLAMARCDQQILNLLATLDQNKVPIVITFRSGNITVSNLETK